MSLKAVGFIELPGGKPTAFDHADTYLDPTGSRLYVAHTSMNAVDVIDCRGATFVRSLPDLPGVAGVLIDSERDLLFTSDRDAARVSMFHCSDETLLGRVDVGPRPNGLASTRAAAFCTASTSASLPARIPARRSSRSTMGASSRPSGFPDGRAGRSSTEPATASTSTSRALP